MEAKRSQKGPRARKPQHLEITILWVHILACFPNSCLQVAAKVNTYTALKAGTFGCDHSQGKQDSVVITLRMQSHSHKQRLLPKLTCWPKKQARLLCPTLSSMDLAQIQVLKKDPKMGP